MKKNIEQLIASLDKANEIYSELIDIAENKREAISSGEIEELEKITNHEMGLVAALYKLEDIRTRIVDRLVNENGLRDIENISQLAEQLKGEDRQKVLDAKNKLLVGIKTVSEETRFNSKLIEEKISLIDLSIQMLTDSEDDDGYSSKGERKSVIDARI